MKNIKSKLFLKIAKKNIRQKVHLKEEEDLRNILKSKAPNLNDFTRLFSFMGFNINNNFNKQFDESLITQIEEFMELNYRYFSLNDGLSSFHTLAMINRGNSNIYNIYQKHFLEFFVDSNVNEFREKINKSIEETSLLKLQTSLTKFYGSLSEINMLSNEMFMFILEQLCNPNKKLSFLKKKSIEGENLPLPLNYRLLWITTLNICNFYRRYKRINKNCLESINFLIRDCSNSIQLEKNKGYNFSEDTKEKILLYKSLYYLKLENYAEIEFNETISMFLEDFKPFICMNYEHINHVSKLQISFGEILKELGLEYELEKKTEFCVVDFFIKPNIIIEVNGPFHYVSMTNNFKAKHILTRRVLRILGYNIIDVYYKDMLDKIFVKRNIVNELNLIKNKKY